MDRSKQIIRTSWIGIAANVLLAGFKAAVGVLASSVAIVMDAVNNLSDALSSVITIVGTKLSQRPADRKLSVDVVPDDTIHDDSALVSKLTAQIHWGV